MFRITPNSRTNFLSMAGTSRHLIHLEEIFLSCVSRRRQVDSRGSRQSKSKDVFSGREARKSKNRVILIIVIKIRENDKNLSMVYSQA